MTEVGAYHLLIKHAGSRNPVSRRTGQSTSGLSREAAIAELEEIKKVITPDNFQQMAQERSDCGSFADGGSLGMFGPGQMMAPFEEATFALQVGEISGIVETDSGAHLIMRFA